MGHHLAGPLPDELLDLAAHDDAMCTAFVDGASLPVPEPLRRMFICLPPADGPLDGLSPTSQAAGVALFERARREGHARGDVRVLANPSQPYRLHIFDVRQQFDCYVAVVIPISADEEQVQPKKAPPILTPRHMELRVNVNGLITSVDAATTHALGWQPEEMVGRTALDFIDEADHERSIVFWAELLEEPWSTRRVRQRWIRSDGSRVWVEVTESNMVMDPELQCVIAELVDISDEMTAQTTLAAREELLARLTDVLPLGVAQVDNDGAIVFSNRGWFEIVGLAEQTPFAEFLALVDHADQRELEATLQKLDAGDEADLQVALTPADGRLRVCSLRMSALTGDGRRTGVVLTLEDITERHQLQRRLVRQSERDGLTDLLNRKAIMQRLEEVIADARDSGREAAVAFIDLDGFKGVNDTYGHAEGDALLRTVADRIAACVRDEDLVGRIGGDEFVVVVPDVPSPAFVADLSRRLEVEISTISVGPGERLITASLGVAVLDEDTQTPAELVAVADRRMYLEKRRRKGQARTLPTR